MALIIKWREKNGLNYNGWLSFITKRKLRRMGLGFLVPFDMHMEWRNSSNVTLSIWQWGKCREELYTFKIDSPLASDLITKLRDEGVISSRQTYRVIRAIGFRRGLK